MFSKPIFVALFCALAGLALAHEGATGIVKERMDGMKAIGTAMKSLSKTLRSETPDQTLIVVSAKAIRAHSGQAMLDLFPKGSLEKPTEASPNIWTDWQRFSELANKLEDRAGFFEEKPWTADVKVIDEIGQICKDCHRDFRIKH